MRIQKQEQNHSQEQEEKQDRGQDQGQSQPQPQPQFDKQGHSKLQRIWIKNATVLTMKEGDEPFEGELLIEGSRIAEVRRAGAAGMPWAQADLIIDARGMVAMPGLINAHQHTPMSLLRCFSDDLPLMDWLDRKMLPAEERLTPEDVYWGAKLSMAEMIRSGTTAFADMYIHMNEIAHAVEETGLRASLTRGLIFLADDGGRRMREGLDVISRWSGKADGRLTTMLGPHAPYTCPPAALREVIETAEALDVPIHIHLAETKEEIVKIRERYNQTPTEYLYELGLFARLHVLLAHAVHVTQRDLALLKGMRGGIAHNPVSNAKLGCGLAPLARMQAHGLTVGLGTDGAGSASTVDLFATLKAAAWLQKLEHGDPTRLPARTVLAMATREGAKLLAIAHEVGTLEAGKRADVILVDLRKPHLQPVHDVEALLAYCATGADVDTTLVNGRILMQGRQLLSLDEEEVLRQAATRARRLTAGL